MPTLFSERKRYRQIKSNQINQMPQSQDVSSSLETKTQVLILDYKAFSRK